MGVDAMNRDSARDQLMALMLASWQTQCIRAAVEFRIVEHLAGEPLTSGALAAACGANEPSLRRLLRVLVVLGVLEVDAGHRYAPTAVGLALRGGLAAATLYFAGEPAWSAWTGLNHSIRTGERAFDHVHGMRNWEYYASHPEAAVRFNTGMAGIAEGLSCAIVAAYDFSCFPVIADVGGGHGTLLAEILRHCPHTRAVFMDLDHLLGDARATLAGAGVSDRCELRSGDFMRAVPAGADGYLLKSVLHDWDDDQALTILRRCREAVTPSSRMIVIERLIPERPGPGDLQSLLTDLNMMVMNGGRERTTSEFAGMLASAGFRLERVIPTGTVVSVLEALPA